VVVELPEVGGTYGRMLPGKNGAAEPPEVPDPPGLVPG